MIGATANLFLLNPAYFPESWGWRIGFFIGPLMGLIIIFLRRAIPESPRWMLTHGHAEEATAIVDDIEEGFRKQGIKLADVPPEKTMLVKAQEKLPASVLAHVFFKKYPSRTFLGITMMVTQSFLYNAIFFTYALVLQNFYHISKSGTSWYFFPFAVGNLLGPLILGPLFDTIGRRKMIFATYAIAAVTLAVSAFLFNANVLSAATHTVFWCIAFFFASAGASSAYLTVSEIFPLEVRGQAISYFFAVAQIAGLTAPAIYGALIGDASSRTPLFIGYLIGAAIMLFGGIVALIWGVAAERKGLEDVADPLSKVSEDGEPVAMS